MKEVNKEPFEIKTNEFEDNRGIFSPLVIKDTLNDFKIVQINTVITYEPYTFRGLHWQEPPYDQGKLIRCLQGNIIDFVVDIRNGSPTYGIAYNYHLSDKNTWVYVPEGFAHGYITLENELGEATLVEYIINNDYNKESERGVFMTKDVREIIMEYLPINRDLIINNRDLSFPIIEEIESSFNYTPDEQ